MSASTRIAAVVAPLVNNNEPQAEVIELLVTDGQQVAEGDLLCVLETSKTTADVEAPAAGHVGRLRVAQGDMVDAGNPICDIFDGPPPAERATPTASGSAPRLTRKARAIALDAGLEDADLATLPTDRFITQADIEDLVRRRASSAAPVALDAAVAGAISERSLVVFGGGGLGRCVIEMIRASGSADLLGIVDDGLPVGDEVLGVPVLGGSALLESLAKAGLRAVAHAVGGVGRMQARERVARAISSAGLHMPVLIDPSASVSPSASLAAGAQVHVGARIMARAQIGADVLINTGAIISHDCRIGEHSHIAPGAILAGDVTVGESTLFGMGATALLGVSVGSGCIIGNGAHLLADVPDGTRVGVGQVWSGAR